MPDVMLLVLLAAVTSGVGAVGGLGGAVLLVPALVLAGWSPVEAAPLGLVSVAAGSVAAGARQLAERSVNHRIGVTTELAATTGAVVGALVADRFSDDFLVYLLAGVAMAAALLGLRRKGLRNPPQPGFGPDDIGERVGSLAGAYPVNGGVAPYQAKRLALGLSFMSVSGLVAGTTGASGGFIKTPASADHARTHEGGGRHDHSPSVSRPVLLIVFSLQGRLDIQQSSAVVFGSLVGGFVGAMVQSRLHPALVRRVLSVLLVGIAVVLVVTR
jgi:uncharacterized membrane protein YfcA